MQKSKHIFWYLLLFLLRLCVYKAIYHSICYSSVWFSKCTVLYLLDILFPSITIWTFALIWKIPIHLHKRSCHIYISSKPMESILHLVPESLIFSFSSHSSLWIHLCWMLPRCFPFCPFSLSPIFLNNMLDIINIFRNMCAWLSNN